MAAVLTCGDAAILSHVSAAVLFGLLSEPRGPVHVSVPSDSGRTARPGILLHRRRALAAGSATQRKGIPVTTPEQTLADLRAVVPSERWRRALRQAEVLGLQTGLDQSLPTRSELEDRFVRLCRRHRLPAPEVNVRIGPFEVDFLWRRPKLIVETDGYRYHRGAQAFEDDHERDLELRALGYDVQRLSYRQVTRHGERVAATLRAALLDGAEGS